jgi:hypothetical protein
MFHISSSGGPTDINSVIWLLPHTSQQINIDGITDTLSSAVAEFVSELQISEIQEGIMKHAVYTCRYY